MPAGLLDSIRTNQNDDRRKSQETLTLVKRLISLLRNVLLKQVSKNVKNNSREYFGISIKNVNVQSLKSTHRHLSNINVYKCFVG